MSEVEGLNEAKSQDEDDLPFFSISLAEGVGTGANFHAENDLRDRWQRATVIERNGLVSVSCRSKDIVHGLYSEEDDESQHCSLLVLHFRFDPNDLDRRIKKVQVTVKFSAIDSKDDDPEVDKIFPDGLFFIHPTSQKETLNQAASGKAGVSAFGAELGGELKRDKTVEKDVTNAGTVRGAVQTEGRNYGLPNTASWTIMENTTDKTGAPVSLRATILVKHDNVNFQAHFTMKVTPDNMTNAQTLFKSNPKDDPVLYNIGKRATNKLHNYDKDAIDKAGKLKMINNLGKLDLETPEFSDITFRTVWKNGQKTK